MEKSNEDTLSEVRRYLTDLMVFEGGKFVVPIEVKDEKIVAPMGEEVAPPQAAEPIIGQMALAEEIVTSVRKEADADAMDLPTPATAIVAAPLG